jgi:hypothetical protein
MAINMTKIKLLQKFALGEIGTNILLESKKTKPTEDMLGYDDIPDELPTEFLNDIPEEFMDEPDESFFIDEIEPDLETNINSSNLNESLDDSDDYADIDASEMLHIEPNMEPKVIEQDITANVTQKELPNNKHTKSESLNVPAPDTLNTPIEPVITISNAKPTVKNLSNNEPISVKIPIQPHTVNKTKPRDDNYDTYASNWIKEHGFDKDKNKAFMI